MGDIFPCICDNGIYLNNNQFKCPKCLLRFCDKYSSIRERLMTASLAMRDCYVKKPKSKGYKLIEARKSGISLPDDIMRIISKIAVSDLIKHVEDLYKEKGDCEFIHYAYANDYDMVKYCVKNKKYCDMLDQCVRWTITSAEIFVCFTSKYRRHKMKDSFVSRLIALNNLDLLKHINSKYHIIPLDINNIVKYYIDEMIEFHKCLSFDNNIDDMCYNIGIYTCNDAAQYAIDIGILPHNTLEILNKVKQDFIDHDISYIFC